MMVEQIARVCHEVSRAFCKFELDDHSHLPWEQAPKWQRDSVIAGVKAALANPNMRPFESHDSWMAQKVAEGWTYGEVKDAEAKTHPCIKPWIALPRAQQLKDVLFLAVVRAHADR
jgi:hypothetical protein